MENIIFNSISKLKLSNGSKTEEICNNLQNFTDSYLYLDENLNLYGIDNFSDMPYEKCTLIETKSGFLLSENFTDCLIQVFNKDFMIYLTENQVDTIKSEEQEQDSEEQDSEEQDSEEQTDSEEQDSEEQTGLDEQDSEEQEEEQGTEHETVFRMFMKNVNDIEPICINEKMFSKLEIDNDLDLKETLNISFSSFLCLKGYIVKTGTYFYENVFAEISVYTNKPIEEEIIKQIENDAILNVNFDDVIFFNYMKRENVYSSKVPLNRLPLDLIELCLKNKKNIPTLGDIYEFYYKNSEIRIKNEGHGFYSIFDIDLYFYLSRLHPDFYNNICEYGELPVAQFYYKK